jgi:hypothetical protein
MMRLAVCCAAGLMAGTVPTNGTVKASLSRASARVLAVLQATTTTSGRPRDEPRHHRHDALDQQRLVPGAIGKRRDVGGIEVVRVRQQRPDRPGDRQAPEA